MNLKIINLAAIKALRFNLSDSVVITLKNLVAAASAKMKLIITNGITRKRRLTYSGDAYFQKKVIL